MALNYRWLEVIPYDAVSPLLNSVNEDQSAWLEDQKIKREDYLGKIKEKTDLSFVRESLEKSFEKEKVIKTLLLDEGRSVSLILSPMANSHDVFLIDANGDREGIISTKDHTSVFSTLNFYSNHTFSNITLGPNKRFLFVFSPPYKGTTFGDLIIFDLMNLKENPRVIKNTYLNFLWVSENSFRYRSARDYQFEFEYDLESSRTTLVTNKENFGFRNITNGAYQYSIETKRVRSENNEYKIQKILILKKYNQKTPSIFDITALVPKDAYPNFNESFEADNAFIFTKSYNNSQGLYFIPFKKDDMGNIEITGFIEKSVVGKGGFQSIRTSGDFIFAEYLSGPDKYYKVYSSKGDEILSLTAPKAASLIKFSHIRDLEFKFSFTSNIVKSKDFIYVIGQKSLWDPNEIDEMMLTDSEGVKYVNKFIYSKSVDGTMIPTRVVFRRDKNLDAKTPLFINAYGGHGLVVYFRPSFDFGVKELLKRGGIFAAPGVRGGGEYGNEWYTQTFGTLKRFEDTEAVIVDLHDRKMGSPDTTAFEGWSNGGLLAGVMLTRRPDLFKIVVTGNGLHDMERKEVLDDPFSWSQEFGNSRTRENVEYLRSYSPFLKAQRNREYPTTYIIGGGADMRVNVSHSFKMTAALQDFQRGEAPVILDYQADVGHWPISPSHGLSEGLETLIRKWTAVFYEIGIK